MSYLPFIALALLAISGLLLDAHRRSWKVTEANADLDERDRRAARAQYLRRMRASGTIGVLGALLILHPLVPEEPLWFTLYLLLLVLLCGWMLLLAMVDAFANALRLRKARQQTESLQAKLEREIRAAREQSDE